jgi:RNA polymerase sigma factor (sigma-70 family)
VVSDGELFRRSVDVPEAFEGIFERHGRAVWGYCRRRVGYDAAEEVAAQTFLVAFERRGSFDPGYDSARPWLLGIATNLIRRHLRDERAYLERNRRALVPIPAEESGVADRLDAERLRPLLIEALLALSPDDRDTFLLVAVGELSYPETAWALDVPVGTVRSRIHRARAQLRERIPGLPAIDDEGETDDGDG